MAGFESNIDEVIFDIEKEVSNELSGHGLENVLSDITAGILRTMKRRIHREGRDALGVAIGGGNYSTTPTYINPKQGAVVIAKANKGKTGKTKFADGSKHKTRYYSRGYSEWRSVNKKITNKVNLEFKGDLRRALTFQKSRGNHFVIGLSTLSAIEKKNALTRKYKQNIWGIGPAENKIIDQVLKHHIK